MGKFLKELSPCDILARQILLTFIKKKTQKWNKSCFQGQAIDQKKEGQNICKDTKTIGHGESQIFKKYHKYPANANQINEYVGNHQVKNLELEQESPSGLRFFSLQQSLMAQQKRQYNLRLISKITPYYKSNRNEKINFPGLYDARWLWKLYRSKVGQILLVKNLTNWQILSKLLQYIQPEVVQKQFKIQSQNNLGNVQKQLGQQVKDCLMQKLINQLKQIIKCLLELIKNCGQFQSRKMYRIKLQKLIVLIQKDLRNKDKQLLQLFQHIIEQSRPITTKKQSQPDLHLQIKQNLHVNNNNYHFQFAGFDFKHFTAFFRNLPLQFIDVGCWNCQIKFFKGTSILPQNAQLKFDIESPYVIKTISPTEFKRIVAQKSRDAIEESLCQILDCGLGYIYIGLDQKLITSRQNRLNCKVNYEVEGINLKNQKIQAHSKNLYNIIKGIIQKYIKPYNIQLKLEIPQNKILAKRVIKKQEKQTSDQKHWINDEQYEGLGSGTQQILQNQKQNTDNKSCQTEKKYQQKHQGKEMLLDRQKKKYQAMPNFDIKSIVQNELLKNQQMQWGNKYMTISYIPVCMYDTSSQNQPPKLKIVKNTYVIKVFFNIPEMRLNYKKLYIETQALDYKNKSRYYFFSSMPHQEQKQLPMDGIKEVQPKIYKQCLKLSNIYNAIIQKYGYASRKIKRFNRSLLQVKKLKQAHPEVKIKSCQQSYFDEWLEKNKITSLCYQSKIMCQKLKYQLFQQNQVIILDGVTKGQNKSNNTQIQKLKQDQQEVISQAKIQENLVDKNLYGQAPEATFKHLSILLISQTGKKNSLKQKFQKRLQQKKLQFHSYQIYNKLKQYKVSQRDVFFVTHEKKYDYLESVALQVDKQKRNLVFLDIRNQILLDNPNKCAQAFQFLKKFKDFFNSNVDIIFKTDADQKKKQRRLFFFVFQTWQQAAFAFIALEYQRIKSNFVNKAKTDNAQKLITLTDNAQKIEKFLFT